ncbi:hypothetical protein [Dokdonella sp.]|uniref:hypothetical protein n=1 Tax=Dokdonella sp. TaxID=2291710 RepID=UPI003C600935
MTLWKRYLIDMGPATVFYIGSVIVALLLGKSLEPGLMRTLCALLPMPSILFMAHAELKRLRRRDELRQRIELEAMTIAFSISICAITMLAIFELLAGVVISMPAASILMVASWIGAQLWTRFRYQYWWQQGENADEA